MAERYIRLYKSDQEYFLQGCPISLVAYAVLRDKKEDINLLQLKFKNCSDKTVSGIMLSITTLDQLGKEIETVKGHQYAKLNAEKGAFFGSDSTVSLNKKTPVSDIDITLEWVLLSDGSSWKNEERCILEACLPPQDLLMILPEQLIEEYRRITNQHMKYIPEDLNGSWRCSCGSLNSGERCVVCDALKKDVFEKCTVEFLVGSYTESIYDKACRLKTSTSVDSLSKAVELLKTIPNYKDSNKIIDECNEAIKKRTEYERQEKERQEKAQEIKRKADNRKKLLTSIIVIAVSSLLLFLAFPSIENSTKYERYQKTIVSSNSNEDEKRIALAYITNHIINERISYEKNYEGEEDVLYYSNIVSIEKPLRTIIAECDLPSFITDEELQSAFETYSSSIWELSDLVDKNSTAVLDIIHNRNSAIVTLYKEGYLKIPEDEYKKCCEAYIEDELIKGFDEVEYYRKDPDASTWNFSVNVKNRTLANIKNCKLTFEFYNGPDDLDYDFIVDKWKNTEKITATYHISEEAAYAEHYFCEVNIESLEMIDNDYIGDN